MRRVFGSPATDWRPRGRPKRSWTPFWQILAQLFMILAPSRLHFYDFRSILASIFALTLQVAKNGQEPARNQQRTAHKRTPQNMILEIEFRKKQAAVNKRSPQTAPSQKGGAAVLRRMACSINILRLGYTNRCEIS